MDAIVRGVALYEDKERGVGAGEARVIIERLTWEQFKAQWDQYDEERRDPFGKFEGGFEGQFAVRTTFVLSQRLRVSTAFASQCLYSCTRWLSMASQCV